MKEAIKSFLIAAFAALLMWYCIEDYLTEDRIHPLINAVLFGLNFFLWILIGINEIITQENRYN